MQNPKADSSVLNKKFYRIMLDREIKNLTYYLNILEQTLITKIEEVSANIDLVKSDTDSQNNKIGNDLISLAVEADQIQEFSNLMRQSFLISLYSFMELWLIRDCYVDSKRRESGTYDKYKKVKGIKK